MKAQKLALLGAIAALGLSACSTTTSQISTTEDGTKLYTVAEGDYLLTISEDKCGCGSRWREIYEANMDTIDNPNLIYPGQVLILPTDKTSYDKSEKTRHRKKAKTSVKKDTTGSFPKNPWDFNISR